MNAERLLQLRRVVEAAPDHQFDMGSYTLPANLRLEYGCSTAHCAAGWFALDEWASKNTEILDIFRVHTTPSGMANVTTKDLSTFERLGRLFDISYKDTCDLFAGELGSLDGYRAPKSAVLDNIDLILSGEPAIPYIDPEDDEDEEDE